MSGLVGRAQRAVDTGGERRQVHHQPMPEVHQFGAPGADLGIEGLGDDRREQADLVALVRLATEQPVLQPSAIAVLRTVQVDEHVGHDHLAVVVQRLAQVALAVHLSASS